MTYVFGWKVLNAFPTGFMLSAKISQQVRTTLPGLLTLKGPKHRTSSSRTSHSTGKMEIYHLKFQDLDLGYTHHRWPGKKSALTAASRVGKTREKLLLAMGILPLSPTLAAAPDTSAEANMSFQAMAEGRWA